MMTSPTDPLFELLPLEMRTTIFSYLDQGSIKALRRTSRLADNAVRFGRLMKFKPWTLCDETAKFVLKSKSRVDEINIWKLMQPRRISLTRGTVLQHATTVTLGSQINPKNMIKILEYLHKVKTLQLNSPDSDVLRGFLNSTKTFEYLTSLNFVSGNMVYESEFYRSFANCENDASRLPHLKILYFEWDLDKVSLQSIWEFWWIYFSLHKLIWIHRDSLYSVKLRLFLTIPTIELKMLTNNAFAKPIDPSILSAFEEYINLREKMSDVSNLKNIDIDLFNWEGRTGFSIDDEAPRFYLSEALLRAQTELTEMKFKRCRLQQHELDNVSASVMKCANSLEKVVILPPMTTLTVFNLNCLMNCNSLTTLSLNWLRYNPRLLMTPGIMPLGIKKLSIPIGMADLTLPRTNFDELTALMEEALHFGIEVIDWILKNLKGLRYLELWRSDYFVMEDGSQIAFEIPIRKFKQIINELPLVEEINLSGIDLQYVYEPHLKACLETDGITAKFVQHPVFSTINDFNCKIDRAVFQKFNLA